MENPVLEPAIHGGSVADVPRLGGRFRVVGQRDQLDPSFDDARTIDADTGRAGRALPGRLDLVKDFAVTTRLVKPALIGWYAMCVFVALAMLAGHQGASRVDDSLAGLERLVTGIGLALTQTKTAAVCGLDARAQGAAVLQTGTLDRAEMTEMAACLRHRGYLTAADVEVITRTLPPSHVRWFPTGWQIPPSSAAVVVLCFAVVAPFLILLARPDGRRPGDPNGP